MIPIESLQSPLSKAILPSGIGALSLENAPMPDTQLIDLQDLFLQVLNYCSTADD